MVMAAWPRVGRRPVLAAAFAALAANALPFAGRARAGRRRADYDVILVGGGMAGLVAAWQLRDRRIRLLEAAGVVGGRVGTATWKGWSYATGAAGIAAPTGVVDEVCRALGLQPVEVPGPRDAIVTPDDILVGRSAAADRLAAAGGEAVFERFADTVRRLDDALSDPSSRDPSLLRLDGITGRDWFGELALPAVYAAHYDALAWRCFGGGLGAVSALALLPALAEGIVGNDDDDGNGDDDEAASGLYAFPGGLSILPAALGQALGDRVRTGAVVAGVAATTDGYAVTWTDAAGTAHRDTAAMVILATPAPVTRAIAATVLPPGQADALGRIRFVGAATVALFSDAPLWDGAFQLTVGGDDGPEDVHLVGVQDATRLQRQADPATRGQPGFVTTCHLAPLRDAAAWSDGDLARRAVTGIEALLPGTGRRVVDFAVRRHPHAHAVPGPGAYAGLDELHRIGEGGVMLAGDALVYPTVEGAMASGALAARRAIDRLG